PAQTSDVQLVGGPRRGSCCPPPTCVCPEPSVVTPPTTTPPTTTPPTTTPPTTVPPSVTAPAEEPALPSLAAGVQGGRGIAFGSYIDSALIRNQLRFRFDAAYDDNRPDRAEFFYAKCGCFRGAPGPPLAERSVDYQDISLYGEVALMPRVSVFLEAPIRFLNPEVNDNTSGFADMNVRAKVALVSTPEQVLTFQFRTYIPTGDADRGLGTDHVSLEPALLLWRQVTDQLYLEAELRDWIPIDGTDFAGNVIRYGIGFSYFILGE